MDTKIRLFDILWRTKGAGPSPDDNRRTELYFGGCLRALSGNPCKGCFNSLLWDGSNCKEKTVGNVVDILELSKVPKYITIVGGEPTDQPEALVSLGENLKKRGYNLLLFTWRSLEWLRNSKIPVELFDIIVSGPYVEEQRIYDHILDDGIHNAIGSGNQIIFLPKSGETFLAADVAYLRMENDGNLTIGRHPEKEVKE